MNPTTAPTPQAIKLADRACGTKDEPLVGCPWGAAWRCQALAWGFRVPMARGCGAVPNLCSGLFPSPEPGLAMGFGLGGRLR